VNKVIYCVTTSLLFSKAFSNMSLFSSGHGYYWEFERIQVLKSFLT
jgi:hypothetical protein